MRLWCRVLGLKISGVQGFRAKRKIHWYWWLKWSGGRSHWNWRSPRSIKWGWQIWRRDKSPSSTSKFPRHSILPTLVRNGSCHCQQWTPIAKYNGQCSYHTSWQHLTGWLLSSLKYFFTWCLDTWAFGFQFSWLSSSTDHKLLLVSLPGSSSKPSSADMPRLHPLSSPLHSLGDTFRTMA